MFTDHQLLRYLQYPLCLFGILAQRVLNWAAPTTETAGY